MAKKRPPFSFPELEQRGRNAILRSADEVRAEEALLSDAEASDDPSETTAPVEQVAAPPAPTRSTRPRPRRTPRAPEGASTNASVRARTHAGAPILTEQLRQKLLAKQHLTSYTFRFRPEELERLDRLVAELNQSRTTKLSKNDLVRLALSWLLSDYEQQGRESLVMEVIGSE
jgi:hypothetical protein